VGYIRRDVPEPALSRRLLRDRGLDHETVDMDREHTERIIALIKRKVVPAVGCTEPIAVALAGAKARDVLGSVPDSLRVVVSGNILKNAMGVGIPGTTETGLFIASALGALGGDPDAGLEVLKSVSPEDVGRARAFVREGRVSVEKKETPELFFIEVTAEGGGESARVVIRSFHTNVTLVEKNGVAVFEKEPETTPRPEEKRSVEHVELNVEKIYRFAATADFRDIEFILDGLRMNMALAEEGLRGEYGLQVGKKTAENIERGFLASCMMNDAVILSTAAVDARMAGTTYPAMSNSGSGNQGITAMVPVGVTAGKLGKSDEETARALILSNLVTIYIKSFLGTLSALCGAVVAAAGASCGITYLLGGDYKNISYAINNMAGNITGIICDGAKPGCAFKVSTGVIAAFESAFLAMDGITASGRDGIVEENIEKTIRNLTDVGSKGMSETDRMIQHILECK